MVLVCFTPFLLRKFSYSVAVTCSSISKTRPTVSHKLAMSTVYDILNFAVVIVLNLFTLTDNEHQVIFSFEARKVDVNKFP